MPNLTKSYFCWLISWFLFCLIAFGLQEVAGHANSAAAHACFQMKMARCDDGSGRTVRSAATRIPESFESCFLEEGTTVFPDAHEYVPTESGSEPPIHEIAKTKEVTVKEEQPSPTSPADGYVA